MAQKMPLKDFRAIRIVLEATDFADAPGPAIRPVTDLVNESQSL
jgi:hypothetical protein